MVLNEVDPQFGDLLRALLEARGISYRALAARVYQSKTYVHDLASGRAAAEEFARSAIDELLSEPGGVPRPRRVASARLDLALALLAADRPDEAGTEALSAVTSGRIVPSNWWRAAEVLAGVESSGVREAKDLRDACLAFRPTQRELTS
jgi:transcriptional regulator with XRE-family HTH domain